MRNTVIVDSGPLIAAIDRDDPAHAWAVEALRSIDGRFLSFEGALAETMHGLRNHADAWQKLSRLAARLHLIHFERQEVGSVCREGERWAPRMDFVDACAVHLVRTYAFSYVLTTDFRDFSVYRVPFASPQGHFFN